LVKVHRKASQRKPSTLIRCKLPASLREEHEDAEYALFMNYLLINEQINRKISEYNDWHWWGSNPLTRGREEVANMGYRRIPSE
jgi:hypothetical protein